MISKNRIKYIHSLEQKKHRRNEGVFVAEGPKLVAELLAVLDCVYVACVESWHSALSADLPETCACDIVTEDELVKISFLETPQQVLAVFRQPEYYVPMSVSASERLCLALDDVQNPGNLGTIVRLADWFGIEDIYCSLGCADIYNPKTVQATMGAVARVRVHYVDLVEQLRELDETVNVYGTFLDGENVYDKTLEDRGVIIMGNEGRGVSDAVASYVNERLRIPNYPEGRKTSESLNVAIATAVICAEFRRKR